MNAIVAKRAADPWPAVVRDIREEIANEFWTFTIAGVPCSAHRLGQATIGGALRQLWLLHAPRAVLRRLRDVDGLFCRTLKELATGGDAAAIAFRGAWRYWLVDGTWTPPDHAPRAVSSFPWRFSGNPGIGVDGAMDVTALVRPFAGALVAGDHEDYDGEEAAL